MKMAEFATNYCGKICMRQPTGQYREFNSSSSRKLAVVSSDILCLTIFNVFTISCSIQTAAYLQNICHTYADTYKYILPPL